MQELSKQKPDTRATAGKAKLDWELEKVTTFYFYKQLTIRVTYSGIRSILQAERLNNFLNLIDREIRYWVNAAWNYFSNTLSTPTMDLAQESGDEFPRHKGQAPRLYPHSTEVLAGAGHRVVSQNRARWFQQYPGETELSWGSKADVTTK